jgi:hypothetical protein
MGNTVINGGTLTVASFANTTGNDYGSLGDVSKNIIIQNGATLCLNATSTSNQPILIGSGGGAIKVNSGVTLTQSGAISGSGQTLIKTGSGTLNTPASISVKRMVIEQGTVNASESNNIISLPDSVIFLGGTLKDPVNMYSYSTSNTNFVVPAGKTGTFYGDARCNYKGKLIGAGTFNVYATSVRSYFQGNWSAFEGTLVANTFKSDSYDPAFFFDNSYGLPKATLRISSGVVFDNNGKSMSLGSVSGTGTLGGSGTYTIGSNNQDISVSFSSSAPIIKTGTGTMTVLTPGALASTVTVNEGQLVFDTGEDKQLFGGALTVQGSGSVVGSGLVSAMTLNDGTQLTPRSQWLEEMFGGIMPAVIKSSATVRLNQGSTLNVLIDAADSYSSLEPRFLTMNGTVKVILTDNYKPKAGDEFTLWKASGSFTGTPTFDLPDLPEGLFWVTSGVAAKEGVLRITDDSSQGIGRMTADTPVDCEVFTASGVRVATLSTVKGQASEMVRQLPIPAGTYIVRLNAAHRSETVKVIVR